MFQYLEIIYYGIYLLLLIITNLIMKRLVIIILINITVQAKIQNIIRDECNINKSLLLEIE